MAITASELRIGNVLKYFIGEDGVDWQETVIDAQDILWCQNNPDNFNKVHKPMELSPEVLKTCGFDTDKITYWFEYSINGQVLYFSLAHMKDSKWRFLPDNRLSIRGIEINYLHQVQNFIYCLTGKELNYQP